MNSPVSRREFLAGAVASSIAGGIRSTRGWTEISPKDEFGEFDYGEVELTGGPLKEFYDRIHASYLALDDDRLLKVYRERAGLPAPGLEMGGWYAGNGFVPGHSLGQYISGLARIGRTTGDSACQEKVAGLVAGFAATLGSKNQVYAGRNAEDVWPSYILDKHLVGLNDAYRHCGVAQAADLLPRVLDGALPFIPERGRDRVGKKDPPYDETYVLPENLFEGYALTGDRRFHDRAVAYLLDREFFNPLAEGKDVLPGRHAYSHVIALSSAGKARLALHADHYLRSMQTAWQLLTTTQQYASGGWGPNETFIEPHRGQLYESLRSTDDHFETPCGSYAAIKLARYLLCATGDGQYGDGLERVLYNCLLGAKEPDGDGDYPYYSTYGAKAEKVFYKQKWPCCSGTLVQGVADFVKNIYFRPGDGVAVNLYAPSRARFDHNGSRVTIEQETEYPLQQSATLRVLCDEPATFTMRLRIPGWLEEKPRITVNGILAKAETRRGFALVNRRWQSGDRVSVELPLGFRTEPIDDSHPTTVANLRGPLLYVKMNPAEADALLPRFDSLREVSESAGIYAEKAEGRSGVFVPFYFVRNERYTTYFEKS
jgi:DUF1680 family protein